VGYKQLQEQYRRDQQDWQARLEAETKANESTHKSLAISQALAARPDLVEGAADHLSRILATDPNLEVVREDGRFLVRTRTLQSVTDYLASLLEAPQNRLFLRATSTGGAGATAFQAGTVTRPAEAAQQQPANLGEAWVRQLSRPARGGDPLSDLSRSRLTGTHGLN
jgi:hypothetical protein